MQKQKLPSFDAAREEGEVTHKDGYHHPGGRRHTGTLNCGCKLTTEKGAYRDVTVELPDGRTVHYYHQTPVVVEENGIFRLNSGGYRTSTTKERINRYLPRGFRLFQEDFDWFVSTPDGDRIEFEDGLEIEA